jgi:hypothetical protein
LKSSGKHAENKYDHGLDCGRLSTAMACFWAIWGIIENIHEGWYCTALKISIAPALHQKNHQPNWIGDAY